MIACSPVPLVIGKVVQPGAVIRADGVRYESVIKDGASYAQPIVILCTATYEEWQAEWPGCWPSGHYFYEIETD